MLTNPLDRDYDNPADANWKGVLNKRSYHCNISCSMLFYDASFIQMMTYELRVIL